MSSITGSSLKISLFGESHGEAIGMVIDSMPSGIEIDYDFINKELEKRKPKGNISTSRKEDDEVKFLSGIFNGVTTGAPLSFIIENKNTRSKDYIKGEIRPSHADLSAYLKYDGFNDYRGGGHFSGRITASIVVLGAIMKKMLLERNVKIGSHIKSIHGIKDIDFNYSDIDEEIDFLNEKYFATLSSDSEKLMLDEIEKARLNEDSVGGELEVVVKGMKAGIGEPYFDSVESRLSSLIFSVGGVKGITFGDGALFSEKYGSEMNDSLEYENGNIKFLSNHNGGINGGITNGNLIKFNVFIKPTPSISKVQRSINIKTGESIDLKINGRHDPCIVHRARIVIEALTAYALVDLIMENNKRKWKI